jgi:Leucine-rich repeat (LRR) protein
MFFWIVSTGQNTQSPEQIRQEMARIRQTTNWDDPAAAKKANEQIRELAKKLMAGNQMQAGGGVQQQQQGSDTSSKDAQKMSELNQEMIDQKMDIWAQIWKSAAGGEGADILLAEPLREKIVQEFKDDETPSGGSNMLQEEITFLCIDMSSSTVRLVIDQMENYKSIKTLIITGGKNGSPVDLNDLLTRAKNYPLENLYVINFKQFLRTVPEIIGKFSKLQELALFNNNLGNLPSGIGNLSSLRNFYVDMNPLITLSPAVDKLAGLDTLGVAKTQISDSELDKISQLLPKCVILKK